MRTSLKTTAAAGTVTAMVLGGAMLTGTTGAQASSGRQLAGTWAVSVDPDGVAPPPFTSTIVYTATGSLVETTMNRPPSTISTGLGTWERLGDGEFTSTFEKYRFDDAGNYIGRARITEVQTLAANGDSYTARATTEILNTAGNVVGTFTADVQATRR